MQRKILLIAAFLTLLTSITVEAHTIGEHYQGGVIFWVDEKGEHGLIAALHDQSGPSKYKGTSWFQGCNNSNLPPITGATKDGIFAGAYNTKRIIEAHGLNTSYAALLAANYIGGWYGDWYLPSKEELNLMYQQRKLIGGFSERQTNNYPIYWSSTAYITSDLPETASVSSLVWAQCFDDKCLGQPKPESKCNGDWYRTRAIRAF